jgi:hypothetical protein
MFRSSGGGELFLHRSNTHNHVSEPSLQREESKVTKYEDDEMQIKTQVTSLIH